MKMVSCNGFGNLIYSYGFILHIDNNAYKKLPVYHYQGKKTLYFCMEHKQIKIRLLTLYTGVILMLLSRHHVNNGQNAMIFNN